MERPDIYWIFVVLVVTKFWLIARGYLVPRGAIERAAESRDDWREAARRSKQEMQDWQACHDALAAVVDQQEQVLAGLGVTPPKPARPAHRAVTKEIDRLQSVQQHNHFASAASWAMAERPKVAESDPMHFEDKGACAHPEAIDVEISTGEVVAQICTTCGHQIVMDAWKEVDLVDEERRTVRGAHGGEIPKQQNRGERQWHCLGCDKVWLPHPHPADISRAEQRAYKQNRCKNCAGDHPRDDCPYPS